MVLLGVICDKYNVKKLSWLMKDIIEEEMKDFYKNWVIIYEKVFYLCLFDCKIV